MLVFEYKLDKKKKTSGLSGMSIVEAPAVEVNFIALSKEPLNEIKLALDLEQHIITGPAMIPDIKIFRSAKSLGLDEDGYIYFSAQTIKDMSELFLENELMNTTTIDHDLKTSDIKLVESWLILNKDKDKAAALGFDLPVGTWMTSYKVQDEAVWSDIKSGKINGFSIEATDMERIPMVNANHQEFGAVGKALKVGIGKWLVPQEKFEWQVGDNDNHCPHCLEAQNMRAQTKLEWSATKFGTPRSGKTFCKNHCQCKLVPQGSPRFIFKTDVPEVDCLKPTVDDSEETFIPKCIKYVLKNGEAKDNAQAYAICKTKWDGLSSDESEFNNEAYLEVEYSEDDIYQIFEEYIDTKK